MAKCGSCGAEFEHPSIGDFSYGEIIFYTEDGKNQAYANAFDSFPQKIKDILDTLGLNAFWDTLATISDPVCGQQLVSSIRCSSCSSQIIEYWEGERVGEKIIPDVSYEFSSQLNKVQLLALVKSIKKNA